MGNIWSGGGTLVAWSSLLAVAGFARVPVVELARRCFIPVVSGLVVSTVLAVWIFGPAVARPAPTAAPDRLSGPGLLHVVGRAGREEFGEQAPDPASISSRIGRTASMPWPAGSVELPVLVALAREDRAGVAAAHGDDDVGGLDGVGGEDLRALGGDVDAVLGHGLRRRPG